MAGNCCNSFNLDGILFLVTGQWVCNRIETNMKGVSDLRLAEIEEHDVPLGAILEAAVATRDRSSDAWSPRCGCSIPLLAHHNCGAHSGPRRHDRSRRLRRLRLTFLNSPQFKLFLHFSNAL